MLPSRPHLVGIVQEVSFKREGLVADCIFPPVQTGCSFSYVDWESELKALKSIEDHVTCKTDAREIDAEMFELKTARTKDHALTQVMDECCVDICGMGEAERLIEAGKTRQLANRLLIGREERAIKVATDLTKYVDNTTKKPYDDGAVIDGGLFKISSTDFNSPNFGLLRYFEGINENAKFGARNKAVMSKATANALARHPTFVGQGCVVDPKTSYAQVAALLGVSEICIADADYNDGLGNQPVLKPLWPKDLILFTASHDLLTSVDTQFSFGITAYSQPIEVNQWLDEKKGKGKGAMIQKQGHDMTEVVLSYKGATLVKIV